MKNITYTNWGKNTFFSKKIIYPKNIKILKKINNSNLKTIGVCGNLRSFNDTCINKDKIISLKKFPKEIDLDKKKGYLTVSSNVLLIDILKKIVPEGFFLTVTPGTKYITVGGMISNNVLGKNSQKNQFKYLIKEIKLLTSQNKIITCSNKRNKKFFDLTIGGFGLTGIIINTKLKLKKIRNQYINQEITKFHNLREFMKISKKKDRFNVAWIDSHSLNKFNFKGLYYAGKYNTNKTKIKKYEFKNNKMSLLTKIFLIFYIKNFLFSKIVNNLFFNLQFKKKIVKFDKFFYPQDKWLDFNNSYNKGFFQIQFLVSYGNFSNVLKEISVFFNKFKIKSTFIILKEINEKGKYLNFYGKGYSISFDFEKNKNYEKVKYFYNSLVKKYNLKVNLSKDIISNEKVINEDKFYKVFKKDLNLIDKKKIYNSQFSNRLRLKPS